MKRDFTPIDPVVGETDHHENTESGEPRRDTLAFIRQFARVYCSLTPAQGDFPGIVLN